MKRYCFQKQLSVRMPRKNAGIYTRLLSQFLNVLALLVFSIPTYTRNIPCFPPSHQPLPYPILKIS